ncbi:hypothetical protein TTHERM_00852910 (macronuclear) [Tetrahymena thermophila SB210]|uniref:Uncharacterized protein n=1 Tax=Tetrahymena thermophila (strain SB210) TaxID=312017 RepID=Q24E49_TETTS|nr:hypothetical protein TTHERM_00852910 [Tetrahymena thermophila SB210]EAS06052.4 hypothetical protein TTHERM_00852910 [Tetrahymena thermophila SB210]|eukprot:XP_001026297.4 hypothetical protein TTHERM_00852910 [Tetrahymena thermophila SB210]
MIGTSVLSQAGQQLLTPARNLQMSPQKSGENMKNLLQYDLRDSQINNSASRFKQKQPLSYSDYYFSQNPNSKEEYAKMLDAQIEQKKQYQNIQKEYQRNNKDLGKVNNINPHLIPEPQIATNYGFQNTMQTQQTNQGFSQLMKSTGNYDNVFFPKNELQRTNKDKFQVDRQTPQQSNALLKLTGQSTNTIIPLRLSQSQMNIQDQGQPFLQSQMSQAKLTNTLQNQYSITGGTIQKKTVNFSMPYNSQKQTLGQEDKETFFDKWREQSNSYWSKPQNYRGILKKENIAESQLLEKERKQRELNQALQEQILYKKKKQELEERQRKLEDLVFAEKLRAEQRSEPRPLSSVNDLKQIKAVAAQQDRLQQRNLVSRKLNSNSQNKQNFEDVKELPRTPPNQSNRNSLQMEGPMVRIEKIIDFSSNRAKAPSPRNRKSSQGMNQQDLVLSEVREAAELDMDYIKDYYEFQKKVFNRQMASLQKEVSGFNDQRTQVFKDMLQLREKSKQDHLLSLMQPRDVLEDSKYIMAQRKQNLYNFHQLEDIKSLNEGSNPYLQGIKYLPSSNYNFQNYYSDKQINQLVSHSQLVPQSQLAKHKGKKKRAQQDNYDEQIIGEVKRKLEFYERINRKKPHSAGSKPQKNLNEENSSSQNYQENGQNKNQKPKNKKQKTVENEFLEDEQDANQQSLNASTLQIEKQKRPQSSKNYVELQTVIDLEKFRKEAFNGRKLDFEILQENEKEHQSQVEQYIWDILSQNSDEYDELDQQIDDCMNDIEKMVNKEAIQNPPQIEDKKLSEIEMQRKMKAFLKGKELQNEHLQLLLREQAKEKLRQIEKENLQLYGQFDKNFQNTPKDYVNLYIQNADINIKSQNHENTSQQGLQQQENFGQHFDNQESVKQENQDQQNEESQQKQAYSIQENNKNDENGKNQNYSSQREFHKIEEINESGFSEFKEQQSQKDDKENEEQMENLKNNTFQQQNLVNSNQTQSYTHNKDQRKEIRNDLINLYDNVIKSNKKAYDKDLFQTSLNNIDEMLTYFREPPQKKNLY